MNTLDDTTHDRIADYAARNPSATVAEVIGRFDLSPEHAEEIAELIGDERDTNEAGESAERESDGPLSADTIREHYCRSRPAYEALAELEGNPTVGKSGDYGLYTTRPNDDAETADEWPRVGRPMTFNQDFSELVNGATLGAEPGAERNRTLYAHTSYNEADHVRQWYRNRDAEKKAEKWDIDAENPMPGRRETRAIAAWGDIDLEDDVKPRRPDLTDDEIETVEGAIEAYVEEYAELYGSRDAIYALDSVGGLYIMGAPEATLPAISALRDDPGGRDRFVEAFIDRSNEYLEAAEERVNERVDGAGELIDPDWCNNKNRPYKAPLSIHAKHDAVVAPIDTDAPRYEFIPIEAVDDELIDDATEWANAFTADEHAACVDSLIETLWPDEYDETGSWIKAIRLWLKREREAEQRERERIENAVAAENDRVETHEIPDGARTITTTVEDVFRSVDDISIGPLVRKHCAEWEPTGRPDHFDPGSSLWKDSDSGETCFVNPSKNIFVDIGQNGGKGGPAKFWALKEDIINWPADSLGGVRYWRAIDALRSTGHDIPEFVPEAGSADADGGVYEKTPYDALKRAAVAAGVIPADAFVERENDDGSTYEVFPGKTTYNRTLAELEDRGIDHGREYRGSDADRERARNLITRAETERRINDQLGDDEAKAGLARLIADSKLSASE